MWTTLLRKELLLHSHAARRRLMQKRCSTCIDNPALLMGILVVTACSLPLRTVWVCHIRRSTGLHSDRLIERYVRRHHKSHLTSFHNADAIFPTRYISQLSRSLRTRPILATPILWCKEQAEAVIGSPSRRHSALAAHPRPGLVVLSQQHPPLLGLVGREMR